MLPNTTSPNCKAGMQIKKLAHLHQPVPAWHPTRTYCCVLLRKKLRSRPQGPPGAWVSSRANPLKNQGFHQKAAAKAKYTKKKQKHFYTNGCAEHILPTRGAQLWGSAPQMAASQAKSTILFSSETNRLCTPRTCSLGCSLRKQTPTVI